jgi:hypothetical protein
MRTYRIYHVQRRGTVTPGGEFDCDSDAVALAKLTQYVKPDLAAELWEGNRYVGQAPQRVTDERR